MSGALFHCCDPRRLAVIAHSGSDNAIELVEVLDRAAPPGVARQCTLFVRLLRAGFTLTSANLRISGGERIKEVGILWCAPANALPPQAEPGLAQDVEEPARTLVIRTTGSGDYSIYTLALLAAPGASGPPAGYDPRLSSITFSFKVECPSDYDCAAGQPCPPAAGVSPGIDYLAKDYQGFRRLMLDRLSLLVPGWSERSAADLGVALVELLAYAADNLSYRQDALANEAYLGTARRRVSVRRHARLVDYLLHEGCNARAFVQFQVQAHAFALAAQTQLLTLTPDLPTRVAPASAALRAALDGGAHVFETAHAALLDSNLNRLSLYHWGGLGCCLPRGSTRATLRGQVPELRPGDLLLLEEVASPTTLAAADADHSHRWVVRLTEVTLGQDPCGGLFEEPPFSSPLAITELAWDQADALPFPLCLSVAERPGMEFSVARGNVVLADHGASVTAEALGRVPHPTLQLAAGASAGCRHAAPVLIPARYRPALAQPQLTHAFDLAGLLAETDPGSESWWPASALLRIAPHHATPWITSLSGTLGALSQPWSARRDLLASGADDHHCVVEIDDDRLARLRFGDDVNGKRPDPDTAFVASYRVGNGTAGNVGAEAIAHVVSNANGVFDALRNPLPAAGGVAPEDVEAARRDAPQAFRTQQRAVTAADYAAAAERRPDVQRAAATFRWTGSWYTVRVAADRYGGDPVDARFAAQLQRYLERFRMAGYDLAVDNPRYAALDVVLHVCVKPDYFRTEVLGAVQRALSSQVLPDGRLGLFHPDHFSFGEPAYLSQVIAAAQAVDGVDAVQAERFQRLVNPSGTSLAEGVVAVGSLEIVQLANNPNFRERGRITLRAGGGK